ncbi:MAG TPA: hypothetical protein VH501_03365 [Solirubrobacterales bacterium]|jgi:hypothetical protein
MSRAGNAVIERTERQGEPPRPPAFLDRRLFLGDWGWLIRDPIDLLRATYYVGAVVLLLLGQFDDAVRLGLTAILVTLPRIISVPRLFDLGFVIGMALQAWGNVFSLFTNLGWYDSLVHLTLSFWVAPLFYICLARVEVVPDLTGPRKPSRNLVGILVVTLSLGLAFGACYEIYEWAVDKWLGGNLYISESDTALDLTLDCLGSAAGGALLVLWATRGWHTIRRLPASRID